MNIKTITNSTDTTKTTFTTTTTPTTTPTITTTLSQQLPGWWVFYILDHGCFSQPVQSESKNKNKY
jgi:hypothetical protein